jgi:hypothetical protein
MRLDSEEVRDRGGQLHARSRIAGRYYSPTRILDLWNKTYMFVVVQYISPLISVRTDKDEQQYF